MLSFFKSLKSTNQLNFISVLCPIGDEIPTVRKVPAEAFLKDNKECTGSLILKHSNPKSLGNYHQLHLSERSEYKSIRIKFPILKKNIIVGMKTEGDCCWEIFPTRRHQGEISQILTSNDDYLPNFQVISLRKLICEE